MFKHLSTGYFDTPNREYHPVQGAGSNQTGWSWAVDPGTPQTWNRYAYVGNTPLTAVDPMGLFRDAVTPNYRNCFSIPGCSTTYVKRIQVTRPRRAKPLGHGSGGKLRKSLRSRAHQCRLGGAQLRLTTALAGGSEARHRQ